MARNLAAAPPALLASLAISAAVILLFLANLFVAIGLETGTRGRTRFLQFLAPADAVVAVGLVVAVALCALHRPAADDGSAGVRQGGPVLRAGSFAKVAGIMAAAVSVAALVRGIVDLTIPHQRAAIRIGNLIEALAVALIAAVAALWGLRRPR